MPKRIKHDAVNRFGARLAALRKQAGITQTALAQEIGVSQRMMAYYEGPTAFPPANQLPAMANVQPAKRGPAPKLQQQIERIQRLPCAKQRFVIEMLDTVLAQASR